MNKLRIIVWIAASVIGITSGCAILRLKMAGTHRPIFELDYQVTLIEKTIEEAQSSFDSQAIDKTRDLCDDAMEKLFALKTALATNEYERLHNEIAMLRLKSNHTLHSHATSITSDLFPLVWNSRVEKWINYYTGRGRHHFQKWVDRSKKYIQEVKVLLKKHDLPQDLAYVPIIESGYYPFARSKAGAVGTWQFMAHTGKLNGLKIDYWTDERRDPYKATVAAAKTLRDLYDRFGSWELALAAYNYGPNGVKRRIDRHQTTDYWELNLPRETENFVPKIMATIFIVREPEIFGFGSLYANPYKWTHYQVDGCVDLRDVAKWSGVNISEIHMLNPELKQMCTPPNTSYQIRIPADSYKKFVENFTSKTDSEKYLSKEEIDKRIIRVVYYRVKKGDTIWQISRKFKVSMHKIKKWNNLTSNRIYPRQTLKIFRHGT